MLDEIETMPPRWPAWARVTGVALFAAGFAPSVVATGGRGRRRRHLGARDGRSGRRQRRATAGGTPPGVTGNTDALVETLPPPELPYAVVLAGWVIFCLGLVLAFNAQPSELIWLVPSVLATFLLQQGATVLAGAVVGTLVAGAALGAYANAVGGIPGRPPRLILVLGGFFVLTVGGVGVRGATALLGGDAVSGLQDLADFALHVPTVAVAIATGVIITDLVRNRRVAGRST